MNEIIKSGFLETIFCDRSSVAIDYDFRNPSYTGVTDSAGYSNYLIFNNETGIDYQYSGSKIYTSGNPALSYNDKVGGGNINPNIVSGHFNGQNKLKILGDFSAPDWTAFIVFKHLETGVFDQSKIILSSQSSSSSTSGFSIGINGCNRLFCEHNTPSDGKRIYTLGQELDNKNVISVAKIDSSIQLSTHQFDDTLNKKSVSTQFDLIDFSNSKDFYVGGLGVSGVGYKNFSGYIDSFMMFDIGLDFPERNTFAKSFYCSGYATGFYSTTTETFLSVTGIEYQNVIVGTGITGYALTSGVNNTSNGSLVTGYYYSGITGYLYEYQLVELIGQTTGTSEITVYNPPSGIVDYGYSVPFGNSKILLLSNFDDSNKEVYSFSGRNSNDVNLIPQFSQSDSKYSILNTGSGEAVNLYANGLACTHVTGITGDNEGDFTISGGFINSNAFFDVTDFAIYDLISGSGSLTGISTQDITNTTKVLSSSYVNNRDLYLNGNKLISGIDYAAVTGAVTIYTTNLIDGDLLLLPKHDVNRTRYTGNNSNNFDTNINLFDEQVWVNGLRQIKELDYEKLADFSLKYTTFSLEPFSQIIYNNDTGYFNV
jgi:hypothetical protein